jgi:hypothetical protein
MSEPAPKVSELTGLCAAALKTVTIFQAAASKITKKHLRDPAYNFENQTLVVVNDGTKTKVVEERLRTIGFCVEVAPVLGGTFRDQSGPYHIMDCTVTVFLKCNPEMNANEAVGAQIDMYEAVSASLQALTRQARHPGGEFFKIAKDSDAFALTTFDQGLWVYDLTVTKEATL